MEEIIRQAEELLLGPAGLSAEGVRRTVAGAVGASGGGADWADAYFQGQVSESWHLEEGEIKSGSFAAGRGVGLRAVRGETTAFASSDIINAAAVGELADLAQTAKTRGAGQWTGTLSAAAAVAPRFGRENPLPAAADADKIALLRRIDATLRAEAEVENVIASVSGAYKTVLVARPDGVFADYRPMVSLNVRAVVAADGKRESGTAAAGGRCGYEMFSAAAADELCGKALRIARDKLRAEEAPAGKMPVVLGNGWAGVLLHEAVGHGLESDFNRKKLSAFSGRIGERVAAKGVTVVDAGNISGRRGSLSCDDEGTPTGETVLIEDGVLRCYMQDITNARLTGAALTGNGRRQSYAHPPMPRMTNTFMRGGGYAAEEIIASVQDGIYAEDFNGGEVDITNGNFVFVAASARRIVGGKLGAPVKGATLIGNGAAVMPLVSMAGDDFALDAGVGMCGKEGQWVPVGVGQPTIKIEAITVGGTVA